MIIKNGVKINKTCASRAEQDDYFEKNILAVLVNKQEPNLETHNDNHVVKQNKDLFYSTKAKDGLTLFSEFWFEKSTMRFNNDRTGFKDDIDE